MEYRMYFLVLRHLSGINKAVQTSHAIAEYSFRYHNYTDFQDYVTKDKTIVMLDGGTHQDMVESQRILKENGIKHSYFLEPDINDAMTAICFLVDERIWNRENYLSYKAFIEEKINDYQIDIERNYVPSYECDWVDYIGGKQNNVIYNLISGRKLSQ